MDKQIDHIVVDVEIQKTIEETPGGWDATDLLGVSVACIWQYQDRRMRIYGPDDIEALQARLLHADRISGFNIFNFDFPVIWGYSRQQWGLQGDDEGRAGYIARLHSLLLPKTNDLLRRIWLSLGLNPDKFNPETHGGWNLDTITKNTLGVSKIGNGAEAPRWFQEGHWARVANYCADDVALERDLTDWVDLHHFVYGRRRLSITGEEGV